MRLNSTFPIMPSLAKHFMRLAQLEGRKALPKCLPNPPIGCVLVRDGRVIASGYTQSPGQYHAEAMALSQLEGDLSDVIANVTLEPCSFHGRTPSCAKALVTRGIKRVVVSMPDPDPRNAGAGIEMLKAAGVEVTVGVLEKSVLKDIGPYLAKSYGHGDKDSHVDTPMTY
ncbi:bifunctional diaminohydroxyphosphoribosylaminopyrimidine deaminase/5-amino-6-(5-phosphoribosylamino)uracil reductase RibD [Methylophilus flavus]|uniref:Bifunctional diaminohydroxyphosphoribosylaminopyrimidine deaminase/5-amino-6-(5-phosphoribosylamino)uracil reductase RibD n=1 Tax=Methylophilus flavus TaxID=640084 RepID=A0ABW3P9D6_9PROT